MIRKRSITFDRQGNPTYMVNGVPVSKDEFDMPDKPIGVPLAGHLPGCWPMVSEALAVHPDQVGEANARNKKHGVAARYEDGTGMCQIPDRNDRAKLLKLEGYHDKSAGYGD